MKPYDAKNSQICKICNETFVHNKQGKFTSHLKIHSISLDDYLAKFYYSSEELRCNNPVCNKQVKVRRGIPNSFCSSGCWQVKSKVRKCSYCQKSFTKDDLRVKTCSKECAKQLKSEKISKWHNNMSDKDKKEHFDKIITKTAKTRRKNATPSWNSGKTGIYNDETIQKIRLATLKQMENQTFQKTSIEKKLEQLLKDLKINYKYSFVLEKRQYDFLLPNLNLIIECDGDYWHANPKYYPIPLDWQKERIIIDQEKDQIAMKNGYCIIRFWEDDINNNLDVVKQVLTSYMTHKPQRSWKRQS
ncbi:DUF559 domain-containing protein [Bacillus sp. 1P02SD]|uniref:DUF559 domain-containing protein n=1 Tax=Bacillus sp. 1P02SD TaxID=3132264 RepID=UPI0039A0CF66